MIDEQSGKFVLSCDDCFETVEETFNLFDAAVKYMKQNGWENQNDCGEWIQLCPECSGEETK